MKLITFENLPVAVSELERKVELLIDLIRDKEVPEEDKLMTIQEAAEFLDLCKPTIYGYVSRGEIPVSKRGKRLYFSKQELREWVTQGRRKTSTEIEKEADDFLGRRSNG